MPCLPRPNKKAEKIAFKILGTPINFQRPAKSEKQSRIDKQLTFEETVRIR